MNKKDCFFGQLKRNNKVYLFSTSKKSGKVVIVTFTEGKWYKYAIDKFYLSIKPANQFWQQLIDRNYKQINEY